jgi:phosphatidylserine/phosphatidylglycerophosphate/cardiolipin synthase-like enzyme
MSWLSSLVALALLGTATPARADSPLRLILNDPVGRPAPANHCNSEVCKALLGLIEGATTSIDFAVYGMRNQTHLIDALAAAKARGVTIRGVVDRTVDGQNYYSSTDAMIALIGNVHDDHDVDVTSARNQKRFENTTFRCDRPLGFDGPLQCLGYDLGKECLITAHVARESISFSGDIMHNKFFVVDGRHVWTGSTNVSDSGTGGYNANLVTVVDSAEVAGWFTWEFEQLWKDGRYHHLKQSQGVGRTTLGPDLAVEVWFSPQDEPLSRGVRPLLQAATKSVDIAVFFLTHKGITRDLIAAHQRGVKVRVILDATAAKNGYTKHEVLRAAGIEVKVENWGGKMHAKSAAIDGRTLITGSMNWTSAGEGGNDESTIIVHNKALAKQFDRWFEHMWSSIPDKWLQGRPDPESADSTTACSDGVDNDFDKLADAQDPGCGPTPPALPELPPYRLVPKGPGQSLVKGVLDESKRKVYATSATGSYRDLDVTESDGERWFCSVAEATEAGFKPYKADKQR